jgi:hypothetical protein
MSIADLNYTRILKVKFKGFFFEFKAVFEGFLECKQLITTVLAYPRGAINFVLWGFLLFGFLVWVMIWGC